MTSIAAVAGTAAVAGMATADVTAASLPTARHGRHRYRHRAVATGRRHGGRRRHRPWCRWAAGTGAEAAAMTGPALSAATTVFAAVAVAQGRSVENSPLT